MEEDGLEGRERRGTKVGVESLRVTQQLEKEGGGRGKRSHEEEEGEEKGRGKISPSPSFSHGPVSYQLLSKEEEEEWIPVSRSLQVSSTTAAAAAALEKKWLAG